MEADTQPSLDTWKKLYRAADRLRQLAPWEWMTENQLFGVQNPRNGEIGYCCIMGEFGEHLAVAVYLGTAGLDSYVDIAMGLNDEDPMAALATQKCLKVSYEDRQGLDKDDLKVIRRLGLKFRGANDWPLFRSFRPGYMPWFLTEDEARFLILTIEQTIDVAERWRQDHELLTQDVDDEEELYLVRVATGSGDASQWSDAWLAPADEDEDSALPEPLPLEEARIAAVTTTAKRTKASWELAFFRSRVPVQENRDLRPYFPLAIMSADPQSQLVLGLGLLQGPEPPLDLAGHVLEVIEKSQTVPRRIRVDQPEAEALLEPLARRLDIKLSLVDELPDLDLIQDELFSAMTQDALGELET